MWNHAYTHQTTADPARIWQLLGDVDGWGVWNDGVESIVLDGPLAVGTTFRMRPPGEEPVISTIVALDPPRLISDQTDFQGASIRVDHRLERADDVTTITYEITVDGNVPDDVAQEIGLAVSADFPQVMHQLAAQAT